MFIYNFNEKGLDKFETDVNEAIKNSNKVNLVIRNKSFTFTTLLNPKKDYVYLTEDYTFLNFSFSMCNYAFCWFSFRCCYCWGNWLVWYTYLFCSRSYVFFPFNL